MLAIFMVTNLNDSGAGSLRQAIWDANDAAGSDVIEFDEAAVGTINLTSGELAITDALSINGPGPDIVTINANEHSRVFNIDGGMLARVDVEIIGVTITGGLAAGAGFARYGGGIFSTGSLSVINSTIAENTAGRHGGGIYVRYQTIIINSTISDNTADGDGGGVFSLRDLTVTSSTISGNTARQGGGIHISGEVGASVTVADSTISGNRASFGGGGIRADGEVTVTNSAISGNTGRRGGGIHAQSGDMTIANSTISGNTASSCGGGIFDIGSARDVTVTDSVISGNTAAINGGGICSIQGRSIGGIIELARIRIANSTISGNTAGRDGGGIYSYYEHVTVTNSTISGNSASLRGGGIHAYGRDGNYEEVVSGDVTVTGSILSGNTLTDGRFQETRDVDFASLDANHSLLGLAAFDRVTSGADNIADDNPQLAPLADNGGPTFTHALLPGSPAIDAGDPGFVSAGFDQRGAPFARVVNGRIDIGAYEFGASNAADLNGNGFVDFEDLTVLLAAWNQNVSAAEGNLVDADTTPVNFEDLTVLLAAWTGPGAAGAPVGRRLAAAVGGDAVGDSGGTGEAVAVGDASYRRREKAPRQAAAYGSATGVASYRARRAAGRFRPAGESYGRLQAVAVDRAMAEEVTRERIGARRRR